MPVDSIPQRPCNKCGQPFPRTPEHWHKDKTLSEGLRYTCKSCASGRAQTWHHNNIDYAHEQARLRYEANRDEMIERVRRWYWQDPERARQLKREDYQRHREQRDAYSREYNRRHKELVTSIKRAYIKRHPERRKSQALAWNKRNPDMCRANRHRRRARLLAAEGTFTADDIRLQYRSQRGNCWHCGKSVGDDYHVDHLRPLAKDGSNDPRNLVISCAPCNLSKGDRQTWEWNGRLF